MKEYLTLLICVVTTAIIIMILSYRHRTEMLMKELDHKRADSLCVKVISLQGLQIDSLENQISLLKFRHSK